MISLETYPFILLCRKPGFKILASSFSLKTLKPKQSCMFNTSKTKFLLNPGGPPSLSLSWFP